MRISSLSQGALLGMWLCLFVVSFCQASSAKIEESKTPEAAEIKEEKTFLSPHSPILKKHHDFFHHPIPGFKNPFPKHISPIPKKPPVPVHKPKPNPGPIHKSKPDPVPAHKPKPDPVPIHKPVPHPTPVFKNNPAFHHPFFKKPLPPYFSHPKKPSPPLVH
ncbi:hypothetical protein TIFTF001_042323 [Ficus carica]|uniref:Proline-rich protein n=1 Tax=Ficus carica TaxID=3494 RepID=A0AA87ZK67_FICCA|nr:hypothetical protein TIFTF001_042323 [Ficus carica]